MVLVDVSQRSQVDNGFHFWKKGLKLREWQQPSSDHFAKSTLAQSNEAFVETTLPRRVFGGE